VLWRAPTLKFAIVTLGSAGDLHPFLAVARALVERGHGVHLLTQAPYESEVRLEGVQFIPVATQAEHDRTLRHPLLWHPLHGFGVLWRHLAVPAIAPTIEALAALSGDGPLTVLASPLAVGARLARERWPGRIRLLSGYTAPMGLRSIADPMFIGAWQVPGWMPAAMRIALWAGLDRWKLDPMARSVIRRWTEQLGQAQLTGSLFGKALHSPDGGVALYPPWFAPVPTEWTERGVRQTGFPVFEPADAAAVPEAVHSFVNDGRPFVVAYPGSADQRADTFASRVLPACRELGVRTLMLSRFRHHDGVPDPDVLWVDGAPLNYTLPAATTFIHHGGIGSIAQALAAETPQLVLASAYDQFENGARVQLLHQGRWRRMACVSPKTVRDSLEKINAEARESATYQPPSPSKSGGPNRAVEETCGFLEGSSPQP
jgi:rhamnosyltransferase subunit B